MAQPKVKWQPPTFEGMFFLTFNEEGFVRHQGRIVRELPHGHYLVQHFEWMVGDENGFAVVPISEMVTWRFYDDADWWRDEATSESQRYRDHLNRKDRSGG